MRTSVFARILGAGLICLFHAIVARSQSFPNPMMTQSYITPSPNAQTFQMAGNDPVALSNGSQAINIPVYDIKCGSLTMPISLSYNYTGFFPLQDAGWVGLGWALNAGGTITRIIEGDPDGLSATGHNYSQYNLQDTVLFSNDFPTFLSKGYDMAPDIFACVVNGMSDQFIYYQNKAYQLDYDKQFGITWSSTGDSMTVITTDGTTYLFATREVTTATTYHGFAFPSVDVYMSAWQLSQVVSADKKDTIVLTYAPYTWQQALLSYQSAYGASTGTQADLGYDPTDYAANPSIQAQVLQSIACRTTRVSFVPDATLRTDVIGSYPRLREIDIIDSVTGNLVKKNTFSFGYFGLTATNPQNIEHLKLKTFASWNTALSNDTLTYQFSYIGESAVMPQKNTTGIDDWGYYNGMNGNSSLLPAKGSGYYTLAPPSNFGGSNNRNTNGTYSSLCALDTIVYPTGVSTVFGYTGNLFTYKGNAFQPAPGLCITSAVDFSPNLTTQLIARSYIYTADATGQTSGHVITAPNYTAYPYAVATVSGPDQGTVGYYIYKAANNSAGVGGIPPLFYYQEVTEQIGSQNEVHKSSYYFNGYNGLFSDAQLIRKVDYVNLPGTSYFSPVRSVTNSYAFTQDSSFIWEVPYIASQTVNTQAKPPVTYTYASEVGNFFTYWLRPVSTQTTLYDSTGNSLTTTATYNYNAVTRNVSSIQQTTSDGQTLTTKFKYPEDYVSTLTGNMVAARLLSPVLEKEVWMKQNAADSVLISGQVTQYDQTIFKPTSTYTIQTTAPLPALNNETTSGGLYSSLLSTSQYSLLTQTQFDVNANLSTANQASDISVSYIWDYRHSMPIAQVSNAAQADIAYSSFEADGTGNWVFSGAVTPDTTSPTGNNCYYAGHTGGIAKSGLTPATTYVLSYWIKGTSSLSITGTIAGYPVQGKTINGWTYFEHEITGQSAVSVSGSSYIDELRLYPATAQMTTYTYTPLIGKSSACDADNRVTYYKYDGFGRLKVVLDQDHNIIKTMQYHFSGEKAE